MKARWFSLGLLALISQTGLGMDDYDRATLFRGGNLVACFTLSKVLKPVNGVCQLLLGAPATGAMPEAYFWSLGLVNQDFSKAVILDVAVGTSLFTTGLNACFAGTETRGHSHDPKQGSLPIRLPTHSVDLVVSNQVLADYVDDWALFHELARVTKPQGRIVFNVPRARWRSIDTAALKERLLTLPGVGEVTVVSHLNPFNGDRITVTMSESNVGARP